MSYSNIRRPLQPQSPGYRRRRSPSPSSFPPDVQDDRRIVNALGVLPTPPPELEYPRPHQRQDRQRPEVYVPSHEAIFQHQSFDDGSVSRNFGLSGPNIPRCRSPEPRNRDRSLNRYEYRDIEQPTKQTTEDFYPMRGRRLSPTIHPERPGQVPGSGDGNAIFGSGACPSWAPDEPRMFLHSMPTWAPNHGFQTPEPANVYLKRERSPLGDRDRERIIAPRPREPQDLQPYAREYHDCSRPNRDNEDRLRSDRDRRQDHQYMDQPPPIRDCNGYPIGRPNQRIPRDPSAFQAESRDFPDYPSRDDYEYQHPRGFQTSDVVSLQGSQAIGQGRADQFRGSGRFHPMDRPPSPYRAGQNMPPYRERYPSPGLHFSLLGAPPEPFASGGERPQRRFSRSPEWSDRRRSPMRRRRDSDTRRNRGMRRPSPRAGFDSRGHSRSPRSKTQSLHERLGPPPHRNDSPRRGKDVRAASIGKAKRR